jgi:hypothetical protein
MVCAWIAIAACSGRTAGGVDGGAAEDAQGVDAGTDATSCVELVVMPGDLDCATDKDCALFPTGRVCSGVCVWCGGDPVNTTAAARFASATASFPTQVCGPCAPDGYAICAAGQCARCDSPGPPIGCDGGLVSTED